MACAVLLLLLLVLPAHVQGGRLASCSPVLTLLARAAARAVASAAHSHGALLLLLLTRANHSIAWAGVVRACCLAVMMAGWGRLPVVR
jgi:hypothetical protein